MKQFNKPKVIALVVVLGALSSVLVAFQNFTPLTNKIPTDVSDLYMNTALSTALKTKETKDTDRQFALRRDTASDEQGQVPEPKELPPSPENESSNEMDSEPDMEL